MLGPQPCSRCKTRINGYSPLKGPLENIYFDGSSPCVAMLTDKGAPSGTFEYFNTFSFVYVVSSMILCALFAGVVPSPGLPQTPCSLHPQHSLSYFCVEHKVSTCVLCVSAQHPQPLHTVRRIPDPRFLLAATRCAHWRLSVDSGMPLR